MGGAITSWILKIITLIFSIKQQTNQLYDQGEEKTNSVIWGWNIHVPSEELIQLSVKNV